MDIFDIRHAKETSGAHTVVLCDKESETAGEAALKKVEWIKANEKGFLDHLDWHGLAVIHTRQGITQLRLYDEAAWNKEWCNIVNREYGELLHSNFRYVFAVDGERLVLPARAAHKVFSDMERIRLEHDFIDYVVSRYSDDPEHFYEMLGDAGYETPDIESDEFDPNAPLEMQDDFICTMLDRFEAECSDSKARWDTYDKCLEQVGL